MSEEQSTARAQVLVEVSKAYKHRVMNNVHRSDYVEAMVAVALADYGRTRKDPWDGWDCEHDSGVPLEVKQSAAAQPWKLPKAGNAARQASTSLRGRGTKRTVSSWSDPAGMRTPTCSGGTPERKRLQTRGSRRPGGSTSSRNGICPLRRA